MTLAKYLQELTDGKVALKHSGLIQLSGLSPEEIFEFKSAWISMPLGRRREVIGRLVELGDDNAEVDFNAVFRACLKDEDNEVRAMATRGLWECDDRVIIRPLVAILEYDPSEKVRAAAATSLAKFAGMAQEGKILPRDADRIRKALLGVISKEDEDLEVRRRAIEAVASFDSPEIESLIRQSYQSSDPRLRQSAIFAMGRSSNTRWLPIILQETNHNDPAIRYEAANALGQIGDESAVPHLITLIKDEDPQVQLSAVHSLGAIGGPLAKRALQQTLKLGDEALEEAAQTALKNIEFDEDPLAFKLDV